ncbi:MAG: site-specific DNA-methyltransferase [Candidatus Helarchaeota archaeon]
MAECLNWNDLIVLSEKEFCNSLINKINVTDHKDEDLTQEPEMIKAFRDTWELGIHSYLTYLRDRLLLARELLNETGSIFIQIGNENVHLVRCLMNEIFGSENFISQIVFRTAWTRGAKYLDNIYDTLLWYGKNKSKMKYRPLFIKQSPDRLKRYDWVETENGKIINLSRMQIEGYKPIPEGKRFFLRDLTSQGESPSGRFQFEFNGEIFTPRAGRSWSTNPEGMKRLKKLNRIQKKGKNIFYKQFFEDYPVSPMDNIWEDTAKAGFFKKEKNIYVVQTPTKVIERCLLFSTDPGDLVFDPTCGSGTTAYVAEKWGRRWITCDTSRIAITLTKQRLMTALFDYYKLAHPNEGVDSGFIYKKIPHVTLSSLAKNEPFKEEILYDQPLLDNSKARVSGPFTVEAVPAPIVKTIDEIMSEEVQSPFDESISRSGETLRQAEWRDELLKTGIRGKSSQKIEFSRVEPLPGTRWLHADAETKEDNPQRVVISFGPEYAPLEPRQVALAIEEAQKLVPKPKIIVFAAFQFDPEAAKDINETNWPGVTLLKAQMNADLLTRDLKKNRASNESFWLIGQPDVKLIKLKEGKDKGKYQVEVLGFDYYNSRTGNIESGGKSNIAMWMLDPDYDGRSLFPKQVFLPMAGTKEGWLKLAKTLKAEIDEELIKAYTDTISLPFELGANKRIAVKIIDDRGIESLKIIEVE